VNYQLKKVENNFELVEFDGKIMQKVIQKTVAYCKYHKHATEEHLIDVFVKSSGRKVKRCFFCEVDKQDQRKIRSIDWKNEKENVTDKYVKHSLRVGKNGLKTKNIPEVLIEAKRAVIQLKQLTDKLNEPIKECSTHGKLYKDDVIKSGKSRSSNEQLYRCKFCMKEMHKKHYQLNKAKILASHHDYRKNNKEKHKQIKRKSYLVHRRKYLKKENERRLRFKKENPQLYKDIDRKRVDELHDSYVKKILTNRTGLKSSDIPMSLVECTRALIQLKRGIKKNVSLIKIEQLEEKINGNR
jgi:hypothetical protein